MEGCSSQHKSLTLIQTPKQLRHGLIQIRPAQRRGVSKVRELEPFILVTSVTFRTVSFVFPPFSLC